MDEKGQAKIRLVELVQLALFQKKKVGATGLVWFDVYMELGLRESGV